MKRRIWFSVPGQPIGKARGRFVRRGNHVGVYTPAKTEQYQRMVSLIARNSYGLEPITGAVAVHFAYFFPIPKSYSRKKAQLAMDNQIVPVVKPDWDNLGKLTSDALNGICYLDDKQIVSATIQKYYSDVPRTDILVWEV